MVVGLRKMHQRRGAGGGVRACGARARERERRAAERAEAGDSGAERGEGTGRRERDSIADGTALRYIVGEEVAATFESSRIFPGLSCFCVGYATLSTLQCSTEDTDAMLRKAPPFREGFGVGSFPPLLGGG